MKGFRRIGMICTGLWAGWLLRMQAVAAANEAQIHFLEDGLIPRVERMLAAGLWKELVAAAVAAICAAAMLCLAQRQKKRANN